MAKCFKCSKKIGCAVKSRKVNDIWMMPCDAVLFEGGSTFGSAIYDSMVNGIYVEILICDGCLKKAKGTDRLRERKRDGW